MTFSDTRNEPARAGSNTVGCRRGLAYRRGVAAGIGAAMGVLAGRKALVQAKVGRGHSMKHRALDLAASAMQPKYPIEAVSTFLNGFHFTRTTWVDRSRRTIFAFTCGMICINAPSSIPTSRERG
jgi:hypothetical protein